MSGKNNRVRGKSGLLTGVVIVSTGLIAGFQGFELAMSGQKAMKSQSLNSSGAKGERSPHGVTRQVSGLDQLVTASLERTDTVNGDQRKNDGQRLADLIRSDQYPADKKVQTPELVNEYPIVNRAMKRDREPMYQRPISSAQSLAKARTDALTSFLQASDKDERTQKSEPVGGDAEQQELAAGNLLASAEPSVAAPVEQVSQNKEIPFADSADIALFAADMPLPAKLSFSQNKLGAPLLSRSYGSAPNRSPMVPRKFVSGKAFGGLAEREFQKRERRCMTTALYFEARSEPESGQIAVGQVVMNRVRSPDYPDTICGVVYQGSHRRTGCQFSFTCDGKADKPNNKGQWERSKRLANQVLEGQVWLNSIGHATHYHATYVKPRWRRKMARLKQIGRHIFYKSPNISVTDTYQRYVSGKRS